MDKTTQQDSSNKDRIKDHVIGEYLQMIVDNQELLLRCIKDNREWIKKNAEFNGELGKQLIKLVNNFKNV
jgi:hypothetical protein